MAGPITPLQLLGLVAGCVSRPFVALLMRGQNGRRTLRSVPGSLEGLNSL